MVFSPAHWFWNTPGGKQLVKEAARHQFSEKLIFINFFPCFIMRARWSSPAEMNAEADKGLLVHFVRAARL